jgi:DNA repair protein RadC
MIIFIPVAASSIAAASVHSKAIVILRGAHNHPAHPHTKPGSKDRRILEKAVEAVGVVGLTVGKLLNGA